MQKFENMDVIAALEAIMHQNTAYYQSDFAYDIQPPSGSPSYQKAKGVTSLAKRVGKGSVGNPKLFRKAVSSCLFAAPRIRKH